MRLKICFAIASLTLCLTQSIATGQVEGTPAPQIIIERMAEQYTAASSYQDTGVVEAGGRRRTPPRRRKRIAERLRAKGYKTSAT